MISYWVLVWGGGGGVWARSLSSKPSDPRFLKFLRPMGRALTPEITGFESEKIDDDEIAPKWVSELYEGRTLVVFQRKLC